MRIKMAALFISYVLTSVGVGLLFDSIGAGMILFGIMSTLTVFNCDF